MDKTSILVHTSLPLKQAIDTYATQHDMSTAQLIRETLAAKIGYDLTADTTILGRPRTYSSKEERIRAQNERTKNARQSAKRLIESLMHEEHLANVDALETYLIRKGIL